MGSRTLTPDKPCQGHVPCHPVPLTAHSPETIVVPVSGRGWAAPPHDSSLAGLRSNPNPCRGLATPRPQAHRMDAPITRRQAQPGGSTGMPAAAPLASVAHHRRTGAHTARARLHTHAPNRQRTAGQTKVKDSSLFTPHAPCCRAYTSAGRVGANARPQGPASPRPC